MASILQFSRGSGKDIFLNRLDRLISAHHTDVCCLQEELSKAENCVELLQEYRELIEEQGLPFSEVDSFRPGQAARLKELGKSNLIEEEKKSMVLSRIEQQLRHHGWYEHDILTIFREIGRFL
jgi:endonuclease/exonuclease/phosphatase family metal-dependent hydrolase